MLYPPMSELLKHIPSRYLLVNVVAPRARQNIIEDESSRVALEDKPVTLGNGDVVRRPAAKFLCKGPCFFQRAVCQKHLVRRDGFADCFCQSAAHISGADKSIGCHKNRILS